MMSNDTFDSGAPMEGPGPGPDVANLVSGPSIALLVAGIINVLTALISIVNGVGAMLMGDQLGNQMFEQNPAFQEMQNQPGAPGPADMQQFMAINAGANVAVGILGLIVAAVIIIGALKMKKLESHGLAMTASILAMIPCLSSCCLIGLPVGIWCVVVLVKPEVKSAFH